METLVGIGSWNYTGPGASPFEVVARRLAEEGYDGIELDGSREYFHPSLYPTAESRRELTAWMRSDIGIRPSAYNPEFSEHDILAGDEDYLRAVEDAVRFAAECDIAVMRLDTGQPPPGPPDISRGQRVRGVVRAWREAAAIAAAYGVRLAWEFEPGFMANTPSEVEAIVDSIDQDSFGVLFDSCHAHMVACTGARQEEPELLEGGEVELARRLAGRVNLVHLIDSDGTIHDDFTSTHAPFGTGDVDFGRLLAELRVGGYEGPWWTVDLCFWPDADAITGSSLESVRDILAGARVSG